MKTFLLIVLVSFAASAWEPATPGDVQQRITELQASWSGKTPEQIAQDKLQRARQKKPAWVERKAFKLELGPLTYYFAVGRAPQAESASLGAGTATPGGPAGSGRTIDWWFDSEAGVFYTLAVDAR